MARTVQAGAKNRSRRQTDRPDEGFPPDLRTHRRLACSLEAGRLRFARSAPPLCRSHPHVTVFESCCRSKAKPMPPTISEATFRIDPAARFAAAWRSVTACRKIMPNVAVAAARFISPAPGHRHDARLRIAEDAVPTPCGSPSATRRHIVPLAKLTRWSGAESNRAKSTNHAVRAL